MGAVQCDKAMGVCWDMCCNVDWRVCKMNMRLDLVLNKEVLGELIAKSDMLGT